MLKFNRDYIDHPEVIPDSAIDVSVAWFGKDFIQYNWSVEGVGYGQFNTVFDPDSFRVIRIDSETMSKEFIKRLFAWMVDSALKCE